MSVSAPRIITRREWGAVGSRSGTIAPSQRRYYVVHWPVMSMRDSRQWARDIERIHINQGWGTTGYGYLVSQAGEVLEGCGDVRGIHSPTRNSDSWGVCHLQPSTASGVPTQPISDAMKRASVQLYNWLSARAGRQLTRWWHGRDVATACPGNDLRAWVQAGMPAPGGAPAPPPEPTRRNELLTSARAANRDGSPSNYHIWTARGNTAFYRFRNRQGWQPAGKWAVFCQIDGEIISIDSGLDHENTLHFWLERADRQSFAVWQKAGETNWSGAAANRLAGPTPFAKL